MARSDEHNLGSVDSTDEESGGNPLLYRQAIAVLALIAGLVSLYLHLVKIGVFGFPACGRGNECVQAWFSSYGSFLGYDVALIGAVGYGLLTFVAVIGTLPKYEDSPGFTTTMLVLIVAAVAFTWRLKYGEWVMMRIFCVWCAESFITIHACLVLAWLDRRRIGRLPHATPSLAAATPREG
jgi:uncharacterized membrane protein